MGAVDAAHDRAIQNKAGLTQLLPSNLKGSLSSIEEIEAGLCVKYSD